MLFMLGSVEDAANRLVSEEEWETLLAHSRSDRVKLAKRLRAGMSTKTLEALNRAREINLKLLTDNGLLSESVWEEARKAGKTDAPTSELLARYMRVHRMAKDIWGEDDVKATAWLNRPNRALDGETPISLLDSDQGALAVETLLGQISHGLPS